MQETCHPNSIRLNILLYYIIYVYSVEVQEVTLTVQLSGSELRQQLNEVRIIE